MVTDITGFALWYSFQTPDLIFALLKTLYDHFHCLVACLGASKGETIGSSYIDTKDLPGLRDGHPVFMIKFARVMRKGMSELTKRLGHILHPDTCGMEFAIGLDPGPVTAGILNGEHSQLQLPGDTVNMAVHVESTAKVSDIQTMEGIANVMDTADKGSQIFKNEGQIRAKGEGRVWTYWIKLTAFQGSSMKYGLEDDDKPGSLELHLVDFCPPPAL